MKMKTVIINDINMNQTYNLVYSESNFPAPSPKTHYIDVPFSNGSLDLTEAITGQVNFEDITATLSMGLMLGNDYLSLQRDLNNSFLGKKCKIDIGEGWVMEGRMIDIQYIHTVSHLLVNFTMRLHPYKKNEGVEFL